MNKSIYGETRPKYQPNNPPQQDSTQYISRTKDILEQLRKEPTKHNKEIALERLKLLQSDITTIIHTAK